MPPSSTRRGPAPPAPPADLSPPHRRQIRTRLPRALGLALTAVVAVPLAPAAAAEREIFLTREPPAGPPADEESDGAGPSGQLGPAPDAAAAPAGPSATPPPDPVAADPRPGGPRLGPGGEIRVFGGMHQPTFGVALAFDYAFRRAALGVQADYAAWLSFDDLAMHPGAIHFAAAFMHRIPLERLSLRQRLAVGPAILLAEYGPHHAGATGLFFEAAPLGLEVHTRITRVTFVLDAFSLALSAPVLGPDLVAQFQYRATVGLRF